MNRLNTTGEKLDEITFRCLVCKINWVSTAPRVEEAPERDWHPWRYFAPCPHCQTECEQIYWERNVLKMLANADDPARKGRSPEAKAAAAAGLKAWRESNPEAVARNAMKTRFNNIKHGLYAKVALYFPARPGRYAQCTGCPYREECGSWAHNACLHRTELYLKHRIAFQQGDPSILRDMRADLQSHIQAILDDIILAIIRTGVEVRTPEWYTDSDGGFHLAEYCNSKGEVMLIEKIEAHPLLKVLFEMLSRNNLTLGDMNMTPKAKEQDDALQGFLADRETREEDMHQFAARQTTALERLTGLIERSRERTQRDPVLIEHQQEGADDADQT